MPALEKVFPAIGQRLFEIAPCTPLPCGPEPLRITEYYDQDQPPLLRLITGFAEGADTLTNDGLDKAATSTKDLSENLKTEHTGVLPFPLDQYCESSDADHRATLDTLVAKSVWVLTLDGVYEDPKLHTPVATKRRSMGYRAQSEFLMR
ncbi:hypothetical protein OAN94_00815 [Verrucomicrobiales bacterium]|nr:hypothetical protein [Verrucomicrobiales bacterium]MDF1787455.1 hypothetical protein [Verrucomicrobiales bacterium]